MTHTRRISLRTGAILSAAAALVTSAAVTLGQTPLIGSWIWIR